MIHNDEQSNIRNSGFQVSKFQRKDAPPNKTKISMIMLTAILSIQDEVDEEGGEEEREPGTSPSLVKRHKSGVSPAPLFFSQRASIPFDGAEEPLYTPPFS